MNIDTSEVVKAEEFQLVDKEGNIRAKLGFVDGEPCLQFIDSNGCERIRIGMKSDEPSIRILNSDVSTLVAIGAIDTNHTGIMLCDEVGSLGMTMLVNQDKESGINIFDGLNQSCWAAP